MRGPVRSTSLGRPDRGRPTVLRFRYTKGKLLKYFGRAAGHRPTPAGRKASVTADDLRRPHSMPHRHSILKRLDRKVSHRPAAPAVFCGSAGQFAMPARRQSQPETATPASRRLLPDAPRETAFMADLRRGKTVVSRFYAAHARPRQPWHTRCIRCSRQPSSQRAADRNRIVFHLFYVPHPKRFCTMVSLFPKKFPPPLRDAAPWWWSSPGPPARLRTDHGRAA